jgi:hypothetical protein
MAAAAAVTTAVAAGNDATAAREQAVAEFGVAIDRAAAGQTQWRQFGQELITEVDRIGMVSCSVVYYVRTTSTAREEFYHCYACAALVPLLTATFAASRLLLYSWLCCSASTTASSAWSCCIDEMMLSCREPTIAIPLTLCKLPLTHTHNRRGQVCIQMMAEQH